MPGIPARPARTASRAGLIVLAAALFLSLQDQTCLPSTPSPGCAGEPAAALAVFVEGDSPSVVRFQGVVTEVDTAAADGFSVITVRGVPGGERRIHLKASGIHPALERGRLYGFTVETVPGFPSACGLIVQDSSGVIFAGASDQSLGGHVLKEGAPGFALSLEESACSSRPHGDCYDGLYNLQLKVMHDGQTVKLFHPRSARIKGYTITCLVAQRVIYNKRCADAGLQAVSWTIERVPSRKR